MKHRLWLPLLLKRLIWNICLMALMFRYILTVRTRPGKSTFKAINTVISRIVNSLLEELAPLGTSMPMVSIWRQPIVTIFMPAKQILGKYLLKLRLIQATKSTSALHVRFLQPKRHSGIIGSWISLHMSARYNLSRVILYTWISARFWSLNWALFLR